MDHRQLLNFLSVCEEKSFSKAAKRCFITHQGLSKSIKLLENEFNVPLFVRTGSGIETTEFGKALQDAILLGLKFINIEDSELYVEIHLVANRNTHKSAAAEKFIAYAREQLPNRDLPETPFRTE
jgi:DNA-binding transcriptional LysR family regulator